MLHPLGNRLLTRPALRFSRPVPETCEARVLRASRSARPALEGSTTHPLAPLGRGLGRGVSRRSICNQDCRSLGIVHLGTRYLELAARPQPASLPLGSGS